MAGEPRRDDVIERVCILAARLVGGKPWIGHHHRITYRLGKTRVRPLRSGGNGDVFTIGRAVCVARKVLCHAIPHPLLDETELVVADDLRIEQPEQRLEKADVDDLSTTRTGDVTLIDRHHRRLDREHPRQ